MSDRNGPREPDVSLDDEDEDDGAPMAVDDFIELSPFDQRKRSVWLDMHNCDETEGDDE
jgi:hypothetical protein